MNSFAITTASRRGSAFFSTDFSYEDIQSELKFKLDDWDFEYGGKIIEDGQIRHKLSGTPANQRIARELGYGGFSAIIDESTWMPIVVDFVDPKLRPLKTIEVNWVDLIGNVWTPRRIVATNHQTGHKTEFAFRNTQYHTVLDDRLFDAKTLARGLRAHGEE